MKPILDSYSILRTKSSKNDQSHFQRRDYQYSLSQATFLSLPRDQMEPSETKRNILN